jgi:hypothetical protein
LGYLGNVIFQGDPFNPEFSTSNVAYSSTDCVPSKYPWEINWLKAFANTNCTVTKEPPEAWGIRLRPGNLGFGTNYSLNWLSVTGVSATIPGDTNYDGIYANGIFISNSARESFYVSITPTQRVNLVNSCGIDTNYFINTPENLTGLTMMINTSSFVLLSSNDYTAYLRERPSNFIQVDDNQNSSATHRISARTFDGSKSKYIDCIYTIDV